MNEPQQPTPNIEDLLVNSTPSADVEFQQRLEDRVLAVYLQKKEASKVKANGHLATYPARHLGPMDNKKIRVPLTLVATLLMVFLVGSLIIYLAGQPGRGGETHYGALYQTTPTAIAFPTPNAEGEIPVVVTSMRLPSYSQLEVSSLEIQYRRADLMPPDVFLDIESVLGGVLLVDAAENMPITQEMVVFPPNSVETQAVLVTTTEVTAYTEITPDMLEIVFMNPTDVPDDAVTGLSLLYNRNLVGNSSYIFVDVPKGSILENSHIAPRPYSSDGIVTFHSPISELRPVMMTNQEIRRGTAITAEMLMTAYWPKESAAETYDNAEALIGQTIVTDLRPYSPILATHLSSTFEGDTQIEQGRVAIAIPMPDDGYFYGWQVGDTLSITAALPFTDVGESPEDLSGTNQPIATPSTPQPIGPNIIIQEVITDAEIVSFNFVEGLDSGVVVLSVISQNAVTLTWLIDSKIPLFYKVVAPASSDQTASLSLGAGTPAPNEVPSTAFSPVSSAGFKPIVTTNQEIQRGTIVTDEMLTIVYWPEEIALLGAFDNIEAAIGQLTLTNFSPYSPILSESIVSGHTQEEPTILDLPELEPVLVNVPLRAEGTGSVAYAFQPGNHLNILITFSYDTTEESVSGSPTSQSSETQSQRIIEVIHDVEVVEIKGVETAADIMPIVMTVRMSPKDATIFDWALDAGLPVTYELLSTDDE